MNEGENAGVLTLANVISGVRLFLSVPIFIMLHRGSSGAGVFLLFVAAAATDFMDGYAARKRNEISRFGKIIDPLADKVLVLGTLLALGLAGRLPMMWLYVLGAKELALLLGGLILLRSERVVIASRFLGKAATVLILPGIVLLMLGADAAGRGVVGAGIVVSLAAGADYALLVWRHGRSG